MPDVEVFAPEYSCSGQMTSPLPLPTIGAVAGFHSNMTFICGGAREEYADCTTRVRDSLDL